MSKEQIILQLKRQIQGLEKMRGTILEAAAQINNIVETLEDDSKLGAAATYDFGKGEHQRLIKSLEESLKKQLIAIKKLADETISVQEKSTVESGSTLNDSVDKS